jgi:hypothetical protein
MIWRGYVNDSKATLAEIAKLGRHSKYRLNDFSATAPCRWQPHTVENPETGLPFSDASAWELICKLIDECPETFVELVLDNPRGQIAFWTTTILKPSNVALYIKVQLVHGRARGRSFHISTEIE